MWIESPTLLKCLGPKITPGGSDERKNVAFDYTKKIQDRIIGLGADLFGIADVKPLKELKIDAPDTYLKSIFDPA